MRREAAGVPRRVARVRAQESDRRVGHLPTITLAGGNDEERARRRAPAYFFDFALFAAFFAFAAGFFFFASPVGAFFAFARVVAALGFAAFPALFAIFVATTCL